MGARGPASKKPPSELVAAGTQSAHLEPFELPDGDWCAEAVAQWRAYWGDTVSSAPTPVDRAVVVRWITNLNRYLVCTKAADAKPLVTGSTGQLVVNPFYKIAESSLAAVVAAERQLGIGAKNRADLGIAIVAGQKSLADLNRDYGGAGGGKEGTGDGAAEGDGEADPRLHAV